MEGVSEDEMPQVIAQADDLIDDFKANADPAELRRFADETDRDADRGSLDPDDHAFWHAVAAEIRARAAALDQRGRDRKPQTLL
jgi:hypothetical protein